MITDKLKHEISEMLSLKRRPIIEGWTDQEKAEILASHVIDFKPQLLVEVGVFGGRSLFAQAMALRENGMGTVWGIDPWTLDAALEGENSEADRKWWSENVSLEDIYVGFMKAVLEFNLTKYCRWVRERGEVAHRMFNSKTIDFVLIDGNHSELCSCRDVGLWDNKIKPGGFMAMDDCDWPTVAKALKQVEKMGYKPMVQTKSFTIFQKPK